MKPWQYWSMFLLCLAVVLGGMGWVTAMALRLDGAQRRASGKTAFEDNVRLALWRMENAVSPLLARESSRPYFVYSSYYPAERAYNRMFEEMGSEEVMVPSPLLVDPAPQVLLHFQIDPYGRITSPKVPSGRTRELSINAFHNGAVISQAEDRLKEFKKGVDGRNLLALVTEEATASDKRDGISGTPLPDRAEVLDEKAGKDATKRPDVDTAGAEKERAEVGATSIPSSRTKPIIAMKKTGKSLAQKVTQMTREEVSAINDWNVRTNLQARSLSQNASESYKSSSSFGGSYETEPEQSQPMVVAKLTETSADHEFAYAPVAAAPFATIAPADTPTEQLSRERREDVGQIEQKAQAGRKTRSPASINEGLMKPLWLGDMLILARLVRVNGENYVQGCWFNWGEIRSDLIGSIRDLLPRADLEPAIGKMSALRARSLAGLPLRLNPGAMPEAESRTGEPVRFALIIAWACVLAGAAAVGALLAGVVSLSERRGAFVSAVTHELRTPLTTFRMYAEMLAEGMVRDEKTRREYLDTLCAESNRLTHLVENVLSYARLERNKANSRIEMVSAGDLLDRIKGRLNQRAEQAGMILMIGGSVESRAASVRTDVSAVEQILFNLVDNACKYAAKAGDKRIQIDLAPGKRVQLVKVRDHGAGIARDEAKRLFRPFSKSAKHAAESAPGVGLGLALSRRLARQMGGNLTLDPAVTDGACFVLSLPT